MSASTLKALLTHSLYPFSGMRTNEVTFLADAKVLAHGKDCECCKELNWDVDPVWKSFFTATVDKEKAEIAYRILPNKDNEKRYGKGIRYHGRNWRIACCPECAIRYTAWWTKHPRRGDLVNVITARN